MQHQFGIQITSPGTGATINKSTALIRGTINLSANQEIGVTVNRVSAEQQGTNFAAIVPLQQGQNTITAIATNIYGEQEQTSVPDVYAAGDVVEYRDVASNNYSVSDSWANAEEMGTLAGRNMSGAAIKYTGFLSLMNTVQILTTPITTIGMINPPPNGYDVFVEQGDGPYRKLVFKNDVMVGALFIGSEERASVYPYLIKNRIPLGELKKFAEQGRLGSLNDIIPSVS